MNTSYKIAQYKAEVQAIKGQQPQSDGILRQAPTLSVSVPMNMPSGFVYTARITASGIGVNCFMEIYWGNENPSGLTAAFYRETDTTWIMRIANYSSSYTGNIIVYIVPTGTVESASGVQI